MTDTKKPTLVSIIQDRSSTEELDEVGVSEQFKHEDETASSDSRSVEQLMFYRNLKLYLNKMIGKQWLLMYRREEDGTPVFIPNEFLSVEDTVFLAELAKNLAFSMAYEVD